MSASESIKLIKRYSTREGRPPSSNVSLKISKMPLSPLNMILKENIRKHRDKRGKNKISSSYRLCKMIKTRI